MANAVLYIEDQRPVRPGDVVKDAIGREWIFSWAAKPAIRGQPEGEVFVKPVEGGKERSFLAGFFPPLSITDDFPF